MRWLLVLLALIVPVPASAQVVKIVKPECGPMRCRISIATGVIVGRRVGATYTYYILTVYHVTGNKPHQLIRRGVDYQLSVETGVGRFPAKIHSYNGERLLMLLSIDVPASFPELAVMPIADVLPSAGDAVEIHGHSHMRNGGYGVRSVVLRTVEPELFTITSPFQQGESGGPIVKNGKIVGLCEGYYNASKIGFGPSVIAIRDFLGVPPVGSTPRGNQAGQVPLSGGLPVQSGGMSVPPPPEPTDAPKYSPPVHSPREVTPPPEPTLAPRPEPDPRTGPVEDEDDSSQGTPIPGVERKPTEQTDRTGQTDSPEAPTVGRKLANAASTGLDVWAMLAGAGIVVGTGGLGGLALLAWRGLRVARTVAHVASVVRPQPPEQQYIPPVIQTPQAVAVIGTQSPPLPQQVINTSSFIPFETHKHQQAYDWAKSELGRKWPGTIESLTAMDHLIGQHLAAHQSPKG